MALRPIDGVEIPEEELKKLEEQKPVEQPSETGSEPSQQTPEAKGEEKETKVPFHKDPGVQLYIERQIAKRLGEGREAYERRLETLEQRLSQTHEQPVTIGGWTPGTEGEKRTARAIILQAKKEFAEELQGLDREERKRVQKEDEQYSEFLDELVVTEVLTSEEDKVKFSELVVKYRPENQEAAVQLWKDFKEIRGKAKEEGEEEGIKKGQEAKIGSSRKGGEPGSKERSYQQRKLEEPNFDAIVEREMTRLGY